VVELARQNPIKPTKVGHYDKHKEKRAKSRGQSENAGGRVSFSVIVIPALAGIQRNKINWIPWPTRAVGSGRRASRAGRIKCGMTE
jgi:hypothetical protein